MEELQAYQINYLPSLQPTKTLLTYTHSPTLGSKTADINCNSRARSYFLSTISRRATFDRPFSGSLTAALDSLFLCLRALRAAAYNRAGVRTACD